VSAPEEMSRDELLVVVARQAGRLEAQDRQIAEMAGQLAHLMELSEALADKLAGLEHLLSRNSGNSSSPPSRDDDPGKPAAPEKRRRGGTPARARGKQPGAPGHIWRGPTTRTRAATGSRRVAATAGPTWPTRSICPLRPQPQCGKQVRGVEPTSAGDCKS